MEERTNCIMWNSAICSGHETLFGGWHQSRRDGRTMLQQWDEWEMRTKFGRSTWKKKHGCRCEEYFNFDFVRNGVAGCELVSCGSGWGQDLGPYEEVNERSCWEFLNRLNGYCALERKPGPWNWFELWPFNVHSSAKLFRVEWFLITTWF